MGSKQAAAEQQPVLPWMRLPISIPTGSGVPLPTVHGLLPALRDAFPFSELFPVQAAVWRGLAGGHSTVHDICICAPTGSGKTLAYGLPMLNIIASTRQVPNSPPPVALALQCCVACKVQNMLHIVLEV